MPRHESLLNNAVKRLMDFFCILWILLFYFFVAADSCTTEEIQKLLAIAFSTGHVLTVIATQIAGVWSIILAHLLVLICHAVALCCFEQANEKLLVLKIWRTTSASLCLW